MNRYSVLATCVLSAACAANAIGGNSFATQVVHYNEGTGANQSFLDATTALGSPERFTGEGVFPGPVSPVNPPFGPDEIVSVGTNGSLTVQFQTPIVDDPANPFGVDLLVFSNSFFVYDGTVGGVFSTGEFTISVSADGAAYTPVISTFSNGLFPTLGYQDIADPFGATPGSVLTDFTVPLNPALSASEFVGLTFSQLLGTYGSSGGGIPIDIASTGLAAANFVRLDVTNGTVAVDAFAVVPEPTSLVVFAFLGSGMIITRRAGCCA